MNWSQSKIKICLKIFDGFIGRFLFQTIKQKEIFSDIGPKNDRFNEEEFIKLISDQYKSFYSLYRIILLKILTDGFGD